MRTSDDGTLDLISIHSCRILPHPCATTSYHEHVSLQITSSMLLASLQVLSIAGRTAICYRLGGFGLFLHK